MRYFVTSPDSKEQGWDLAALTDACRKGEVDADVLVRSEHQDFSYAVAELVGHRSTRPLHFPCSQCHGMIHSRRIDIRNPVACPQCGANNVVPDVRLKRRLPKPRTSKFEKARTRVIWGFVILFAGMAPVAYWYLHPRPGYNADRYPLVFTVLVYLGLALVIQNWKVFRRGEKTARMGG